jgi:hypothetical protein
MSKSFESFTKRLINSSNYIKVNKFIKNEDYSDRYHFCNCGAYKGAQYRLCYKCNKVEKMRHEQLAYIKQKEMDAKEDMKKWSECKKFLEVLNNPKKYKKGIDYDIFKTDEGDIKYYNITQYEYYEFHHQSI